MMTWRGKCHWKKNLLFAVPKRKRHAMPRRATWESTEFGQDAEAAARRMHKSQPFCVFCWKDKLRVGKLEQFQQALRHQDCP